MGTKSRFAGGRRRYQIGQLTKKKIIIQLKSNIAHVRGQLVTPGVRKIAQRFVITDEPLANCSLILLLIITQP